jgi:hypothetical protein
MICFDTIHDNVSIRMTLDALERYALIIEGFLDGFPLEGDGNFLSHPIRHFHANQNASHAHITRVDIGSIDFVVAIDSVPNFLKHIVLPKYEGEEWESNPNMIYFNSFGGNIELNRPFF